MSMRLVDIENHIKELVEKDINNPEIYNQIYNMAYYFLLRRKLVTSVYDAEGVAHIIAEELYLRVWSGKEIHSWLGYISKSYQAYIRVWKRLNGSSEIIDTTGDEDLECAIIDMCTTSESDRYKELVDIDYIRSIPKVIEEIVNKSKYYEFTKDNLNARLSLLLSLCSNRFVSYNQSKSEEMYTNMLYTIAKDNIQVDMNMSDNSQSRLTLMQLFTLSNMSLEEQI